MKKAVFGITAVVVIAIVIAVSILSITIISISAEEELIPSWIRNIAGFWADRQISDKEFLSALQYLVEQGILIIPITEDSAKIVKEVTEKPTKLVPKYTTLPFVDTTKDPQYYIDRYNNEPDYKVWFDTNYPNWTIEQAVGLEPKKSFTKTESEELKRITERIDGETAFDKIDQMNEFSQGVNREMAGSIIFKDASDSEFLLGIVADTEWQGIIVDGSAMKSIHGDTSALIPFSCDYVGIWMYNLNIQKQTEEGTLIVLVFKDGYQIDWSNTDSPFGIVALDGNCEALN